MLLGAPLQNTIAKFPLGLCLASLAVSSILCGCTDQRESNNPIPLIFDTDMGNDVDDALALGMIHALQSRGECELLAVTVTKDEPLAAPFVDLLNTFYGRPDVPIGVVREGPTPEASKFTVLATKRDDGNLRYPHDLATGADAPGATQLLRQTLANQADNAVVIVQVGFSTNLARLLASGPDRVSSLSGRELVAKKVRMLSVMGGAFASISGDDRYREYNIKLDIGSAQFLVEEWPTGIVFSGFEIGMAIPYPAASIENDFKYVAHHPLSEAYYLYQPPPHERPTWDLTSVLYAVRSEAGYFGVSGPGRVTVRDDGSTVFHGDRAGNQRYLTVNRAQVSWARDAMVELATQPPDYLEMQ